MGELPEPWNTAAEQAGVRQTYRGIGDAADLSHVTVKRLISEGRTSAPTINKVAKALGVDRATVHRWLGLPIPEYGFWEVPDEVHQLNPRARAALTELILAVTQGGQSWSGNTSPEDESAAEVGPGSVEERHQDTQDTADHNIRTLDPKHQRMLNDAQLVDEAAYGDIEPGTRGDEDGEESQDHGEEEPS